MQQQNESESAPNLTGFASLLASLAAQPRKDADAWQKSLATDTNPDPEAATAESVAQATAKAVDELGEDLATLSYENALRTHARYHASPESDWLVDQREAQELAEAEAMAAAEQDAAKNAPAPPPPARTRSRRAQLAHYLERDLKCESITIRMSAAECAQLRQRAAEAGMTISAYLRSCTFEAETLRAQVKEVMNELRAAEMNDKTRTKKKFSPRSCFAKLLGLDQQQIGAAMDSAEQARA